MYRDKLKSLLEKICPVSACEAWDSFKISLFWSCPVITRDEWIAGLTQNSHASSGMLRDSIKIPKNSPPAGLPGGEPYWRLCRSGRVMKAGNRC